MRRSSKPNNSTALTTTTTATATLSSSTGAPRRLSRLSGNTPDGASSSSHSGRSAGAAAWGRRAPTNRAIWTGRVCFLLFLSAVAVVMGYLAYSILDATETRLAERQLTSIAVNGLQAAQRNTLRKRLGGVSLASVASFAAPNAADWPNVFIPGFSSIAANLLDTSSGDDTGFVPFATTEQLPAFEDFAFSYYSTTRQPPFPNGTAVSSFGPHVWAPDIMGQCNTTDRKCQVKNGKITAYPTTTNDLVAPIFHHSLGVNPILMVNTRYEVVRGTLIDNMRACADERKATKDAGDHAAASEYDCNVLADIFNAPGGHFGHPLKGPLSVIMHPIFPAQNPDTLTGFIGSSIVWEDVLQAAFNDEVRGIDCVLESQTRQFTYAVRDGIAKFLYVSCGGSSSFY